jgi:hypothetical protein
MRRISLPALFASTAIAAIVSCSAFHGDEAASASDASADSNPDSPATSTIDGSSGATDGAPTADSPPLVEAGQADAGCTTILAANFDDNVLPTQPPWAGAFYYSGSGSPEVITDTTAAPPTPHGMKAHVVVTNGANVHAALEAEVPVSAQPDHVLLTYSMMLGANFSQSMFYAEMGCTLYVATDEITLAHETGGAFTMSYGSAATTPQVGLGVGTWVDVKVEVTGLTTTNATLMLSMKPHDTTDAAAWQTYSLQNKPTMQMGNIGLYCGIYDAEDKGNTPSLDVWVDEITLSTCP